MQYPTTIFVRPRPGLRIRDPQTGTYLPEIGQLVPRDAFWLRRIADGDVQPVAKVTTNASKKGDKS